MSPPITSIQDLKALFRRRVPRMFFDYVESGSWSETTFRENSADFSALHFRQRVGIPLADRSVASTMIGQPVAMPVALAPVGMLGMQSADGEIKAARAAAAFGIPYVMSTMSICSIEDVARATNAPFWFQIYMLRDEALVDNLLLRARAAQCSALVATLDLQIQGRRHRDIKNGLSAPPRPTLGNLLNMATKLRWSAGMLGTRRHSFGNLVGHAAGVSDTSSLAAWTADAFDQSLDWETLARLRDKWKGKLVLKGIMDPRDAELACGIGADAIVVSNHGGRQLDGAPSTIRMLPAIVAAVDGRAEVHLDGGIRSGQDVLKAIALGARGTYVGRAYAYGVGALGEAGVAHALRIIREELDLTMGLCGVRDIRDADGGILMLDEPSFPPRAHEDRT